MEYTKYNAQNGAICWAISCDPDFLGEADRPYIEGAYPSDAFFIDLSGEHPTPKERPKMQVLQDKTRINANGRDFMTLSNLPRPCVVYVGAERYEVPDGVLEWGTRRAGEYPLRVVAFPWLDWEGTVTAG